MSVRVNDLLKLPSLREATVLSGKNQLDTSVASLSFLEVSDMSLFSEKLHKTNEYHAGEILIGSFCAIRHDVVKQCETIRHLHELGEVGLILYYVGIIVPKVAEEVIQLADSLGFILIQMPKNDPTLRYNEVIYEVMKLLVNKNKMASFATDLLEKVSLLPEQNRSVEMTLKILSDFLKVNIALTTYTNEIISTINWPRSTKLPLTKLLYQSQEKVALGETTYFITSQKLPQKDGQTLKLYFIREEEQLTSFEMNQAVEVVQMALNLWGKNYDEVSEYALVQAIINDESDKMYQLAKKLMIDISSVETMWLLPIWQQGQEIHAIQQDLKDFLRYYYQTTIVQQTENYLIVLLGNYLHKQPEATISKEYLQATDYQDYLGEIILCPKVRNTTEVRVSYQTANQVAPFLKRVYPQRKVLSIAEIRTVQQMMMCLQAGEEAIQQRLAVIQPLLKESEQLMTLGTFLLDTSSDFKECGERLFVHKNTVKYRISKINEALGYDMTNAAEAYEVYLAMILYRLVTNE